jgi:hypothetical protein
VPDLETRAAKIGEAAGAGWWGAHGGRLIEIPLGVVAALALTPRPTRPPRAPHIKSATWSKLSGHKPDAIHVTG